VQALRIIFSLWLLIIGWNASIPKAVATDRCQAIFSLPTEVPFNRFHQQEYKEKALHIMMEGSLNVSRTKVLGRRFMAPAEVKDAQIADLAEANFKKAAVYIIENFESLEMNLQTAVILNKILTEGLVSENIRGNPNFRMNGTYVHEVDANIGQRPDDFYVTWLNSPEAQSLFRTSPVEYAEIVHNSIMSLDSFPDGNGRLSRLFADLALIKSDISPAYYTSMKDYFDRGNARSPVSREVRKAYFYEIVRKGMSALRHNLGRLSLRQTRTRSFSLAA
jgi:hypothetical protein